MRFGVNRRGVRQKQVPVLLVGLGLLRIPVNDDESIEHGDALPRGNAPVLLMAGAVWRLVLDHGVMIDVIVTVDQVRTVELARGPLALEQAAHIKPKKGSSQGDDGRVIVAVGVLTDIDVQATLKTKLGADMPPYRILGACNPSFAHQALQIEDKLGVLLPCNVIVRDAGDGQTEIAAIDPVASMERTGNPELAAVAEEVRTRLGRAVNHA